MSLDNSTDDGLAVRDLTVTFGSGGGLFRAPQVLTAVSGVSLDLARGRSLGVVGESGCGKSTLARAVLRLEKSAGGQVLWNGRDISAMTEAEFRAIRPEMQMVFQDPLASLNPRMKVADIVAEPLRTHRPEMTAAERRRRVAEVLERVGLKPEAGERYPHEFSGGQAQRIGIARAVVLEPGLLICDEAVSALDVSIQAQVLDLLKTLQRELNLSLLFISHNLAVVRNVCDDLLVLYLGRVVERGPCDAVFASPKHPYTQALISSVLSPDPEVERAHRSPPLLGELPSPLNPPRGCAFHTRCPLAEDICRNVRPEPRMWPDGCEVMCHVRNRALDATDNGKTTS